MKIHALIILSLLISFNYIFNSREIAGSEPTAPEKSVATNISAMRSEENQEWQMLFDGKTKTGWHIWQNKTDGSAWKVADGVLYIDTTVKNGGGDLITDAEYENYHLSLEWKISKNGNSGIIFGIKEDPKYTYSFYTGPEMQVLDNDGHPDGKIYKHRAGNLYDLIASEQEPVKPVGEWNTAEIKWVNNKLEMYLNGVLVVSTTTNDEAWNKMVAGSKFKTLTDFGKFTKGKIGLQDHGDPVWYRNIRIRKL